jgi:hypothetical protein
MEVSPETVLQQTEGEGQRIEGLQRTASKEVAKSQETAAPLDPTPATLLAEADGIMVR